ILKALQVERSFKPDIVHVHWPIPNVLWALPFGGKKVLTFHNTELSLMKKLGKLGRVFVPLLKKADFFTFNSTFTRDRFLQIVGDLGKPYRIVPLPVGWTPEVRDTVKERGRVLFVGRLVYWKGGDILLRAAKILKEKGIDLKVVFVGDGPERERWMRLAEDLNVNAEFKGWLSGRELSEEYAKAWLLVLPSRSDPKVWTESLGLVLVEAMMHGTPVIASRVGGPLDLIEEGKNGLFFEVEDYEDLALQMEKILTDERLQRRMGEYGSAFSRHFTPEAIARKFKGIYVEVL
ncbi:MAG: glycosyltransferase family 4 protein, partial [Thermotogae bacterium]|nr:glycosyltransferase family 4 protein [Thermotogota bacterium]